MRVPPARVSFPPEDRAEILARIDTALTSGQLTLGAIGRELEEAFAALKPYGSRADGLKSVARYLVERKN